MATKTYPVKWITSDMRGAPTLNGAKGALLTLVDTFLLTGWGAITASAVSVSDGVATATVGVGDTFVKNAIIEIAGATPGSLNGLARVTGGTTTSIIWDTDAPDGMASGTISIKYAPVGSWEKIFSDTHKAAYRSTHGLASGMCLRVNDDTLDYASVAGFRSMSDINTGTGMFTWDGSAIDAATTRWQKTRTSFSGYPVSYALAADLSALLIAIDWTMAFTSVGPAATIRGFGDALPLDPLDDFAVFLASHSSQESSAGGFNGTNGAGGGGIVLAGDSYGGVPQNVQALPLMGAYNQFSGASGWGGDVPALPTIDLIVSPLGLFGSFSATPGAPRAFVPGVGYIPQKNTQTLLTHHAVIAGAGAWTGRHLLAIQGANGNFGPQDAFSLIDITGPWR